MNKKLIAVAVAGLFAAPAVALAQSSVTISGIFKGGFEEMKYGGFTGAGRSGSRGVVDDSSRIVFNIVEDLGGGLSAVGQYDIRIKIDDPRAAATDNVNGQIGQGNTHVGLRSKSWGRIVIGRQDLHYFNTESNLSDRGSLRANSISLLAFAGGGGTAIAGATRTQNVVHYLSPNWGGFTVIGAYSSNPTTQDLDIGSAVRRGWAWNVNPNYQARNFQIGWSHWESKPDGTLAANQRSDRLYGSGRWGGFKFGLAFDKSKITNAGLGVNVSDRKVWSFPASYSWGNHSIHGHYTTAGNDRATAANDSAKMLAISYGYDLSKRTSAALTYARINNSAGGVYNFFTNTSLGIANIGVAAGEDPRLWGVTLRHQF